MILIKYFIMYSIYIVLLYLFGIYIRLSEFSDLFACFICKEMDKLNEIYDYIVVGCGSSGSIIAMRLAEDEHKTVLVLEAGPRSNTWLDIPGVGPLLQLSAIDWQYRTVPQKNAAKAFYNEVSSWPMGRIVGGTGAINNMIYLRGHPSDFKDWYKDSLSYNFETDILSYYKKTENQRGSFTNNTKYHSTSGPLIIDDLNFVTPVASVILRVAEILGYPVRDLNGEYGTGFMQAQLNINNGMRWTPAHLLFYGNNKRNLVLQTNSLVHKILFKANYEAYAVQYSHLGQKSHVGARKGIILCAGVVGTPKLLMLSGVGPDKHLSEIKIKTKIDLPVGNNLQDHVTTGTDLVYLNTSLHVNFFNMLSPRSLFNYFAHGTGPWTSAGAEVVGILDTDTEAYCRDNLDTFKQASLLYVQEFKEANLTSFKYNTLANEFEISYDILDRRVSSKFITDLRHSQNYGVCPYDESKRPDLLFMVVPIGVSTDAGGHLRKALGINDRTWKEYFSRLIGRNVISILPVLLHPKSRGTVRLLDNDPYSQPVIDPNYLSNPYDIETILKGIEIIKRMVRTEPMQKLGARLNERKFPGCEGFKFDTRPYWECYVRHFTMTSFHPGGTCKMGNMNDKEAVVGYDFRVWATNKLYVADASIMPSLPSSNPYATVLMMAEKAAAEIKYHNYLSEGLCHKWEIFVGKNIC